MILFHLLKIVAVYGQGRVSEIGNIQLLTSHVLYFIHFLGNIESNVFRKFSDQYKGITTLELFMQLI